MSQARSILSTVGLWLFGAIILILIVSAILGSIGFRSRPEPPRSYSQQQEDRADVTDWVEQRPEPIDRP